MPKWLLILLLAPVVSVAAQTNPLWHGEKVKNYLPDMTWPEVESLLSRTDMVIVPVTAIEQHGPQLPIGTDDYTAEELAKLIAQKTDVLVASVLMPGISPYHMEFPGTITLLYLPTPYNGSILRQRKASSSTVSSDFCFSTAILETKM